MKKMFKAAASLAVGCALLSTSAFAELSGTATYSQENQKIDVNVSNLGEGESTIMVLKSAEEITAIPATVDPANIVYIDQKTAAAGAATYSIDPGTRGAGVTDFYVFAGGSNDTAAVFLGKVTSTVAATGVTLEGTGIIAGEENAYTAAVDTGAALAITAAVSPEAATDKTVTWAVTKDTVDVKASVLSAETNTGATFNAAEAGTYVLTATDSASHVATLTITVTNPVIPAAGVTIKEGTEDAAATKELAIAATAEFTAAVDPANSTDTVTWSVMQGETDVTAATLAIAAGVATFTAPTVEADTVYTVTATAGTVSDSIAITVKAPAAQKDYITATVAGKATVLTTNATATDWLYAGMSKRVSVKLDETAYVNAATNYTIAVVDESGNAIEGAEVYFASQTNKYVCLIPSTATSYKFEVISGGNTNTVLGLYGDSNANGKVDGTDKTVIIGLLNGKNKNATFLSTNQRLLRIDVDGNGKFNATDKTILTGSLNGKLAVMPVFNK